MTAYKILDSCWFTNATVLFQCHNEMACIGIVAIRTNTHEPETAPLQWKAYIGVSSGVNRQADEQNIATLGSSLQPQEAHGFFPHLDIKQYKKD